MGVKVVTLEGPLSFQVHNIKSNKKNWHGSKSIPPFSLAMPRFRKRLRHRHCACYCNYSRRDQGAKGAPRMPIGSLKHTGEPLSGQGIPLDFGSVFLFTLVFCLFAHIELLFLYPQQKLISFIVTFFIVLSFIVTFFIVPSFIVTFFHC